MDELRMIRLLAEHRLVVKADVPKDDLVANLMMLAQAGFRGMVTETLRFELNGQPVDAERTVLSPNPQLLRPPPDPRVIAAANELRKAAQQIDHALGLARREESPTEGDGSEGIGLAQ